MLNWLPYVVGGGFVLGAVLFRVGESFKKCTCDGGICNSGGGCSGGQCQQGTCQTCNNGKCSKCYPNVAYYIFLAAALVGFIVLILYLKHHFPDSELNSYMGRNLGRPPVSASQSTVLPPRS
ncbi:CLUMA_CG020870, isoform A [Babesia caballi]|uniref:CLUMA_CG020870, isoform A n=1 Tax=Babesia caballi TaxID=5871 RepID=A0AAV4LZ34_BABCB|nr:CLUMA_CG020870, isoform A [Babesia caballi]